jgi:glycosyltransferase involved in cell wall biosynthesis
MVEKIKVLFLVPYPLGRAPSQRFRVELFLPFLQRSEVSYKILPFLDDHTYAVFYGNSSSFKKGWGVFIGFLKRIKALLSVSKYDYVFIHREASPLGPPFFEFVAAKLFHKKIIYDFDDAIWIPNSQGKLLNYLKAYWKIGLICRWAYKVVGGNDFLCSYARRYNDSVFLIPTCVDAENKHNKIKDQAEQPITIGWTGSHSTLRYLDPIVPVLKKLAQVHNLRTLIICNKPPKFSLRGLIFIPWNKDSEVEDLLQLHVGIMPLEDDVWSQGKCGFKLVQYLSLGIPAVASPVGVNNKMLEHGINGFLCSTSEEWENALLTLISDVELRRSMGNSGRKKMNAEYSVQAYEKEFVGLFK